MKKILWVFLGMVLLWCLGSYEKCFAMQAIEIQVPDQVEVQEEWNMDILRKDSETVAIDLQIYFDEEAVELVKIPENAHAKNGRLLYTWFDQKGGEEIKADTVLDTFTFKAKQEGKAYFQVEGIAYDKQTNEKKIEKEPILVQVGEQEKIVGEENKISEDTKEETAVSEEVNNANLDSMRLNIEGIQPNFDKNITQYYFVADEKISSLEIEAIPENPKAQVTIKNHQNLHNGINDVQIEVIAENGRDKKLYQIEVTKTSSKEKANTNLETLAIEQGMLTPAFDPEVLQYQIEVANAVTNLRLLAIPQDIQAEIEIQGNETLQVGENVVSITVIAANGITKKQYEIKVYRRNQSEEEENQKQEKEQIERLSSILKEQEAEGNLDKSDERALAPEEESKPKEEKKKTVPGYVVGGISATVIVVVILAMVFRKNKRR